MGQKPAQVSLSSGARNSVKRVLVTGGCGFIGSHLGAHYLSAGYEVIAYDNFSRRGAAQNAEWLQAQGDGRLRIVREDVRDFEKICTAVQGVDVVVHLAAQVAVENPMRDFEINALGGMHVLEAVRTRGSDPIVLYASTNKVYGSLEDLPLSDGGTRYQQLEYPEGIPEDFPIDLHSPYGCSKGTSDLYMIDYARIYGLRTVVFRQSCIYGPRQLGIEDQGWISHFVISAMLGRPITIYGDGRQVRDALHILDLIDAFDRAVDRIETCKGEVYNIGGGPDNTLSLLELIGRLETKLGFSIPISFDKWRLGDQRVFVSDISKVSRHLGWKPQVPISEGLDELCAWVERNIDLIRLQHERGDMQGTRAGIEEAWTSVPPD
jgi:CDP-paratose 2-epimerase